MESYDHLPVQFTPNSMTTLGVPVSGLYTTTYPRQANHRRPTCVGRDALGREAAVVFPTWTFVEVTWSQAAWLTTLLAGRLELHDSLWGHQPWTSLFTRLLNATHRAGSDPTDQMRANFRATDWVAHVSRRLRTPNMGMLEDLLLERAEAADLYVLVAPHAHVDPRLTEALLDAALPAVLFPKTAHGQMDLIGRRARVVVEGRAALPDAFLVP